MSDHVFFGALKLPSKGLTRFDTPRDHRANREPRGADRSTSRPTNVTKRNGVNG